MAQRGLNHRARFLAWTSSMMSDHGICLTNRGFRLNLPGILCDTPYGVYVSDCKTPSQMPQLARHVRPTECQPDAPVLPAGDVAQGGVSISNLTLVRLSPRIRKRNIYSPPIDERRHGARPYDLLAWRFPKVFPATVRVWLANWQAWCRVLTRLSFSC
jgi:hypothetical protein